MKRLFAAILTVSVMSVLIVPSVAFAQAGKQAACEQLGAGADCSGTPNSGSSVEDLVADVINILSIIIGAVSVIVVMVGGLRYLTSAGDAQAVTGAKNTILYAIVGLVVALLAQALVRFVFTRTTT